jgi:hypothetical protein
MNIVEKIRKENADALMRVISMLDGRVDGHLTAGDPNKLRLGSLLVSRGILTEMLAYYQTNENAKV